VMRGRLLIRFIFILFFLLLILNISADSMACSTFMLRSDKSIVIGHNLDERLDYKAGYVFINKRGAKKTNFNLCDYYGRASNTPKIQWVSKYGSITFNTMGREFADSGINEAGLYVGEMTLLETEYPKDNSKPHIFIEQWVQYQLDNYQSVNDVIQNLNKLIPVSNAWHFFVADKQGNGAIIEFIDGKAMVRSGDMMPIPVLCNSRYDYEIQALNEYQEFGGTIDPFLSLAPGHKDSRFFQAAIMIKNYHPEKLKPPVDYSFDILKQLERGNNKWQIVIDTEKKMIYFNTSYNRRIKYFSYRDLDFSQSTPVQLLSVNSEFIGDVSQRFENYTYAKNRALTCEYINFIRKVYPGYLENNFVENGTTFDGVINRIARHPDKAKSNIMILTAFFTLLLCTFIVVVKKIMVKRK